MVLLGMTVKFMMLLTLIQGDAGDIHPKRERQRLKEKRWWRMGFMHLKDNVMMMMPMRLGEDALESHEEQEEQIDSKSEVPSANNPVEIDYSGDEGYNDEVSDLVENGSVDASYAEDDGSEQSWMLRSLSESSVACSTGDFAMQNVILQMSLHLLSPGMQICELNSFFSLPHGGRDAMTKKSHITG